MSAREPKHSGESRSVFSWCGPSFFGPAPESEHKKCRVQFECWGRMYYCSCPCHPQPADNQGKDDTDGHLDGDLEEPGSAPDEEPVTA